MQTVLGSTGTIGNILAKSLTQYTNKIRLVSRTPKKINEGDELISANLFNETEALKAIRRH